ncbi:MAG: MurR/RpiR family transcriptional regulator [Mycolicibacterium rufum]|uniref:DNA-binding transcriptional regulator HexR n=1 Tax=Mycolicibacterium chlorophenolicum TaxID=37916 RepID=A0A0J6Z0X0_9MYCO|nr:MurR/RpiR family transcriptional regulator [Mycolicibacterium chlorophenolicum]KMO78296.1 DNA-binding transcriptional regulator HexR [Mycolicibacterium chlorophenolicum]MBI5337148.1 MurR/RpiR family transcriptional regulator [Mycolicibacterium rufum]
MSGIADQLRDRLGDASPAERKVGRVLLSGYPLLALETATTVAHRAEVSTPTVIRLVTRLGYRGYPDFQQAVRAEMADAGASPAALYDAQEFASTATTDPAELTRRTAPTVAAAVHDTMTALPEAELSGAVALLADPKRRIHLVGGRFSGLIAHYLCLHLTQMRAGVQMLPSTAVERSAVVSDMGRRDVLVAFDYRRYEPSTAGVARWVRERGGAVILFTDPWLSPTASQASIVLPCRVDAPSPYDSMVPTMAVAELLVTGVLAALGDGALARMREIDDAATALDMY